MVNRSTKHRILDEALILFSVKGYHSVSVEEIAKAVGIKAPSLYKHYRSKKNIFDAIFVEMKLRYGQHMEQIHMNGMIPESELAMFENISESQLVQIGRFLFSYFLHDEYNQRIRKMLIIEQFREKDIASLYCEQYFNEPIAFQESIFLSLMKLGRFIQGDPKVMALHFYAPIRCLIALCDALPERETEVNVLLESHLKQFYQIYRLEEN